MENYKEFNKKVRELKAKIKVAAEYQRFLKNQRKTERLVGKREIHPGEAAMKHLSNRLELRSMYAAYTIIRGKDVSCIDSGKFENPYDESHFKQRVEKLVLEYTPEIIEQIIE